MEQTNIILNYKLHADVFQPLPHARITVHRSTQNYYITSSIPCIESHTYYLEDGLTCHKYNPLKLSTTCKQTNLSLAKRMPRYQQNTNISSQTMPQRTSGTYTILNQSYHEREKPFLNL